MQQDNNTHNPNKCVFVEPNPTYHQLTQEAKINTNTQIRILANQYLLSVETYAKWWEKLKIEQK